MNAVAADMLTAELRKRLAEMNTTSAEHAGRTAGYGGALGARAVRLACVAAALHMTEAATQCRDTGETPVPLEEGTP